MKYKAVIFDLDGVITDTAEHHYRAWAQLAKELGIPFSREDNERLKGVSRIESLDIILSLSKMELAAEEKRRLERAKTTVPVSAAKIIAHKANLRLNRYHYGNKNERPVCN